MKGSARANMKQLFDVHWHELFPSLLLSLSLPHCLNEIVFGFFVFGRNWFWFEIIFFGFSLNIWFAIAFIRAFNLFGLIYRSTNSFSILITKSQWKIILNFDKILFVGNLFFSNFQYSGIVNGMPLDTLCSARILLIVLFQCRCSVESVRSVWRMIQSVLSALHTTAMVRSQQHRYSIFVKLLFGAMTLYIRGNRNLQQQSNPTSQPTDRPTMHNISTTPRIHFVQSVSTQQQRTVPHRNIMWRIGSWMGRRGTSEKQQAFSHSFSSKP